MQSLAGKVAIVTGAGSGIGQRIAHVMAERGAKILVAASREESASGTTKSIRDAGGIAESVYGDLADINVPEKIVQAAMEAFGKIDVLVNNAAFTDAATLANDANITDMDGPPRPAESRVGKEVVSPGRSRGCTDH